MTEDGEKQLKVRSLEQLSKVADQLEDIGMRRVQRGKFMDALHEHVRERLIVHCPPADLLTLRLSLLLMRHRCDGR